MVRPTIPFQPRHSNSGSVGTPHLQAILQGNNSNSNAESPSELRARLQGLGSGGAQNGARQPDHSYGQSRSPEIQEVEEKDPLALDDDDLEAVDPYTASEPLIIPTINPDVDKDLAADEDDVTQMNNFKIRLTS